MMKAGLNGLLGFLINGANFQTNIVLSLHFVLLLVNCDLCMKVQLLNTVLTLDSVCVSKTINELVKTNINCCQLST